MEYLLESVLCLLLLLVIHRLILQQEVLYRFNRFFLLAAVLGSFLIPLITIEVVREEVVLEAFPEGYYTAQNPFPESVSSDVQPIPSVSELHAIPAQTEIPWVKWVWIVYLIGFTFFLIRFIRNIRLIRDQIQKNIWVVYRQEKVVLLPEMVSPFSFLNYIFYSKNAFEKDGIPEAIFLHEQCHVREKHTWDVLLIEALLVVFWFHPGLYLARQAVKLNHEFIADHQVIKQFPVKNYQYLLMSILSGKQEFALGSSLNFSLTKKRFEMMNQKTPNSTKWMKILSLLPILAGLVYLFSEKVPAKTEGDSVVFIDRDEYSKENQETHILIKANGQLEVDGQLVDKEELQGLIESKNTDHAFAIISGESGVMMDQVAAIQVALRKQNIRSIVYENSQSISEYQTREEKRERHFREAIFLIESTDMDYSIKRYPELSEKERTGLLFTDKQVEKKTPDVQLFEQWKNEKEFALWIDGKAVANTVLANYQPKDFVWWFQSGVKPNARSVRFPQPFQVTLYSPGYFTQNFGPNSEMFRPRTNRDTITITLRKMTSMKDLSRYPDPVTAFLQKNARYEKLKASPEASSPEVKQEIQRIFEELEVEYSKTLENRKQRLKKPVPPSEASSGKSLSATPQNKSTYWSLYSKYETKVNRTGLFGKLSQEEIALLEKEYRLLDLTFARLSLKDKMQVKRPAFPFAKLTQEGKIIYKKIQDLTEEEKKSMAC